MTQNINSKNAQQRKNHGDIPGTQVSTHYVLLLNNSTQNTPETNMIGE